MYSRNFRNRRPLASKMHGTLCRCGRETKEVWQLVGTLCWNRLPSENARAIIAARKSKDKEAIATAERAAIEWLIANPQS